MNRENCVLIDWLSITTTAFAPSDIMIARQDFNSDDFDTAAYYPGVREMMALVGFTDPNTWELLKGVRGYKFRYYRDSITIHFGGREDNGVWLEMSGQGCRSFESYSDGNYDRIFAFVLSHPDNCNLTRLDIAFDEYTGIVDIDRICDDTAKQKYVSKADFWEVIQSSKGKSLQVGSPSSLVLVRVYDKLAERLAKIPSAAEREKVLEEIEHWTRVEVQLRDDRAREFVRYLFGDDTLTEIEEDELTLGQAFTGVLKSYLEYGYYTAAKGHPEQKVWHTFPYWKEVLQGANALSIYRTPGVDYNLQRCVNYIQNIAGNAVDALLQIYGYEGFTRLISEREIKPNKKYQNMIERFETEERERLRIEQEDKMKRLREFMEKSSEECVLNGERWCFCRECGKVAPAKAFAFMGGPFGVNGGICKKCF